MGRGRGGLRDERGLKYYFKRRASLDTQNSREGSRFTVGMKARGFWITEACEVNVQKCERRAEPQGLLKAQLLGKSWNFIPRSQLKLLYLYLIIRIFYPHTTGSIEVVVAMAGLEAHAGVSLSFTLPHDHSLCRSEICPAPKPATICPLSTLYLSSPGSASLSLLAIIGFAISVLTSFSVNCEI
jgi:hypothetical protein